MQHLREMEIAVQAAPDRQISLTDPDARAIATSGKGTGIVGYNVQTAVDVEHHLIVAHEVTNLGHDRTQLVPMALRAQEATGNKEITVLADRGYFSGDQVLSCEGIGVAPIVPKTLMSSGTKRGLFARQDFIYDAEHDHYTCPAGETHQNPSPRRSHRRLRPLSTSERLLHLSAQTPVHANSAADHQTLGESGRARQDAGPPRPHARGHEGAATDRRTPVRDTRGLDGDTHFLTRTLNKVRTEMSLHVLAYNLKRMITIFGVGPLMAAIRT